MPKKSARRRGRRGGGWFGADEKGPGPFGSLAKLNPFASSTPAPAPAPVPAIVSEPTQMAQTAGKRLKKHIGVDFTSPKDARKLLKTAKGDTMLGGRRTRRTIKRRRS